MAPPQKWPKSTKKWTFFVHLLFFLAFISRPSHFCGRLLCIQTCKTQNYPARISDYWPDLIGFTKKYRRKGAKAEVHPEIRVFCAFSSSEPVSSKSDCCIFRTIGPCPGKYLNLWIPFYTSILSWIVNSKSPTIDFSNRAATCAKVWFSLLRRLLCYINESSMVLYFLSLPIPESMSVNHHKYTF